MERDVYQVIGKTCTQLKRLELHDGSREQTLGIAALHGLQDLALVGCAVNDEELAVVVDSCPLLQRLHWVVASRLLARQPWEPSVPGLRHWSFKPIVTKRDQGARCFSIKKNTRGNPNFCLRGLQILLLSLKEYVVVDQFADEMRLCGHVCRDVGYVWIVARSYPSNVSVIPKIWLFVWIILMANTWHANATLPVPAHFSR